MRRTLLPLAFLFAAVALIPAFRARPAHADALWCFDDPVISVGGRLVDVQVQMPIANLLTMRSTTLTVVIPKNVSGAVVLNDVSAFPMRTIVSATGPAWNGSGSIPITVTANVSAWTNYPIKLTVRPVLNLSNLLSVLSASTASGTANTPLVLRTSL